MGEFLDLLGDAEDGPGKERVERHLQEGRFVVANQLLADIDDDGYAASSTILDYFVRNAGGLVRADGEGFYDSDELIVEVG